MQIHTIITTDSSDSFTMTTDEAAAAVLAALGGNPRKDHSIITVQGAVVTGRAGTPPMLPPPVPEPEPTAETTPAE